jgi:hypothetical protein
MELGHYDLRDATLFRYITQDDRIQMIKSANSSETSDCNYPYLKVLSDVMARISNHRLPSKETDDLKRFNFFTICILCVSQKCILDITLVDT